MLDTENAVLVVVDVQGRLAAAVAESAIRLSKITTLIKGAQLLGLPVLLTAQAPEKIGHTHPEVSALLPNTREYPRSSFNIMADQEFSSALRETRRSQVVLCGYETHICIYQSALALAGSGYEVFIVQDGVSSRDLNDKAVALAELHKNTAVHLLTVEMLFFDALKDAKHPAFKPVSQLIR